MAGPLDGITVLDFTWALAGPYGVMVLADLGADVWKVETPFQNEKRRGNGPYVHGVSTYFFSVNRGKKSIMLDLKVLAKTAIMLVIGEKTNVDALAAATPALPPGVIALKRPATHETSDPLLPTKASGDAEASRAVS